jgi:hypothetical protein
MEDLVVAVVEHHNLEAQVYQVKVMVVALIMGAVAEQVQLDLLQRLMPLQMLVLVLILLLQVLL